MNKQILFVLLAVLSISSFGQTPTQISGSQIKNGSIDESKLQSSIVRSANSGVLSSPFQLTFNKAKKTYTLPVTSDIALSLKDTVHKSESYIFIYATGDGLHTLSFPADWIYTERSARYNPNLKQRIFLEYVETPTPDVFITIEPMIAVVIPTLSTAHIAGGTDDVNLNFSAAVNITTAGWTVTASGGAVTVSSVVSGNGLAAVVLDLSRNITAGEVMSISYNPSTGSTTSSTGNEIALISNFTVDTGDGAIPDNSIRVGPARTYTTMTAGINAATFGQTVVVDAGTYRETPTGKAGVTIQPAPGETVICSCLEPVPGPWTSHDLTGGKSIYKTTITLPVDNDAGYNLTIANSNTQLFNNQIFKSGTMQFEARYPNITTEADLLDFTKMRHYSQANMTSASSITDSGLPTSGLTGAKLAIHGWFRTFPRTVTSQSSTTINWSGTINNHDNLNKYRHYYYIAGEYVLLDAAKEWHYDNVTNTLYLWQTGGGSPTGIEYKARNWGFDVRGVDDFTIRGITFIGCEVARGSTTTDRNTVDNVRATYTNHDMMYEDIFPGYGNATETGTQLLGIDNVFKNSEARYGASHGVWLGTGGLFQNNWFRDYDYDGSWGAPVSFAGDYPGNSGMAMWGDADNVKILNNTFERMGRSAVDMSFSYHGGGVHNNLNIEVAYNEITQWGMINVDVGAVYSWGFRNLTGSSIHHNWIHDDGIVADPTGAPLHGGQYCVYFDQASGPYTVHHNIFSNNWTGLPTNAGDSYNQSNFEHRNAGSSRYYNNTYASTAAPYSHKLSVNSPKDIWRNNIFVQRINQNWGNAHPADEQYNLFDLEITGTSISSEGTGTVKNADFSGTNIFAAGSGSMAYIPSAGSIARNTGVVIEGITDDDDSSPDKGARRYGDPDPWVPGYNAVTLDDDAFIENTNLVFTQYSVLPTVQSGPYNGGSASWTNTNTSIITITFTGTNFEWYAEKYNHAPIVEVRVDGVRQDCDSGTGGTQDCDLYVGAAVKNSQLIFSKTGMSNVEHEIELVTSGRNASNTTGYYVVHDYIKYTP